MSWTMFISKIIFWKDLSNHLMCSILMENTSQILCWIETSGKELFGSTNHTLKNFNSSGSSLRKQNTILSCPVSNPSLSVWFYCLLMQVSTHPTVNQPAGHQYENKTWVWPLTSVTTQKHLISMYTPNWPPNIVLWPQSQSKRRVIQLPGQITAD